MLETFRLRVNGMQFFSEEGDNSPVTAPEGGDPSVTNTETTPPSTQEPPAQPPVTFTQEQMDEAKQKQEAAFLKKLGVENLDQLKQSLKGWNEHQESLKTEQEKTNEKLTTFETQLKEKDESLFNLQAENAAIKSGITEEKNLSAVITLAKTKVSDDIDITKAIEMVVEEFPHFKDVVEEPHGNPKPTFTTGQHQKNTPSVAEQWAAAFK
ncbi:D52 family tumor protein [Bacillus bingmayongensis]|uniref:D52 family tumor protein n=1 Tax=Bacillus bingmayongensis TaxID=1150157 RepID=UPI001C8D4E89|nr:D52 family tumor protein [Bacillus bingmayongensis]MBY0597692.1 D52 family tumor protein [Bacillus bingmayongensis]